MSALEAAGVAIPGRLAPVDMVLEAASLTALVGPNGAGKTSLLHALAGIGRPMGSVTIAGRPLAAIAPRTRAGALGYVPASRELAWPLSVRALVTLTAPAASADDVAGMLDLMALSPLAERRADRLSTGERSRVLIARALLPRPIVLLLDEPFANLDPLWQLKLSERLRAAAQSGMAVLFSAHDLDLASGLASQMLVMDGGACVADGAPNALIADGTVARVFGVARDGTGWRAA